MTDKNKLVIKDSGEHVKPAGKPVNGRALVQHEDGRLEPVETDRLEVREG